MVAVEAKEKPMITDTTTDQEDAEGSSTTLKRKINQVEHLKAKKKQHHQRSFRIMEQFGPILFMDYLSDTEIVIVERPWLHIVEHLPDVLYRHQYGA